MTSLAFLQLGNCIRWNPRSVELYKFYILRGVFFILLSLKGPPPSRVTLSLRGARLRFFFLCCYVYMCYREMRKEFDEFKAVSISVTHFNGIIGNALHKLENTKQH